ncbi:hypothetical protein PEX1_083750 [Penicillium expansum]|uniref:Uncharacterized protein n=1 Tax=Penicillium expansum TaxID=27334 RepID=A0A0A2JQ80_PENEN|nr:hypothetical protein PEX2_098570 [Penicillium expansum]KGO44546.1 hypothetical protein PEXP_020640 [Penicillium expansum]KGO56778.1 hypothetical protein PEX2_098570 [Penicillium expansum]KGO65786.1 hypothetical protein PEX1_083750 [Penicillium expansum]
MRVTEWQGLVRVWVSLVAQRLFKKYGAFGKALRPIREDSWRFPRVPICRILHGLIACDLPKTESWKFWEPWGLITNENLVMNQGGASHNREICAWRFPPPFCPRYPKSNPTLRPLEPITFVVRLH